MPPATAADVTLRAATLVDIPEIIRQRRSMYEDMHYTDSAALGKMGSMTEEYLKTAIPELSFHAWLACDADRPVGGGAVLISPWPAHADDLQCRRATILNLYIDPEYRRRGIARRLMQTMLHWCRQQGLARVTLHTSEPGRPLYESLGFQPGNEMRLDLR